MSEFPTVVIVGAARTPMGSYLGELSSVPATELGSTAIAEAVKRANITPDSVNTVYMGNVLPGGLKQGPARQAAKMAGLPNSAGATTLNKLCGSGMKCVMLGHDQILLNPEEVIVAGGMESMTRATFIQPRNEEGKVDADAEPKDQLFFDGLQDAYSGQLMGVYAQDIADERNFSREQMDEYAIGSLKKARNAIEQGHFVAEMAPVTQADGTLSDTDQQPSKAKIEKIPQLRPAFKKEGGTVTAANSSSISDGASALVLMSEQRADELHAKPLAKIIAHSTHSHEPELFTTAPVGAVEKLLEKTGWSKDDVDLWEINEAFAVVSMLAIKDLGLDPEKVNVNGGACALGHPIGSSGSRILVTLIYALQRLGKKRGIASLCIGGGEATAIAIELL